MLGVDDVPRSKPKTKTIHHISNRLINQFYDADDDDDDADDDMVYGLIL